MIDFIDYALILVLFGIIIYLGLWINRLKEDYVSFRQEYSNRLKNMSSDLEDGINKNSTLFDEGNQVVIDTIKVAYENAIAKEGQVNTISVVEEAYLTNFKDQEKKLSRTDDIPGRLLLVGILGTISGIFIAIITISLHLLSLNGVANHNQQIINQAIIEYQKAAKEMPKLNENPTAMEIKKQTVYLNNALSKYNDAIMETRKNNVMAVGKYYIVFFPVGIGFIASFLGILLSVRIREKYYEINPHVERDKYLLLLVRYTDTQIASLYKGKEIFQMVEEIKHSIDLFLDDALDEFNEMGEKIVGTTKDNFKLIDEMSKVTDKLNDSFNALPAFITSLQDHMEKFINNFGDKTDKLNVEIDNYVKNLQGAGNDIKDAVSELMRTNSSVHDVYTNFIKALEASTSYQDSIRAFVDDIKNKVERSFEQMDSSIQKLLVTLENADSKNAKVISEEFKKIKLELDEQNNTVFTEQWQAMSGAVNQISQKTNLLKDIVNNWIDNQSKQEKINITRIGGDDNIPKESGDNK